MEKLKDATDRLIVELHEIKGFHSDSVSGYKHFRDYFIKAQEFQRKDKGNTIEELDQMKITIAKGDPDDPNVWIFNESSQGDFKARLDKNGSNEIRLSQLCIVMLYDKWEGELRKNIADALNVKIKEVQSPIFGDIRHIRNDAVHHYGIATKEHAGTKCEILNWFQPGQLMEITADRFDEILEYIFNWINSLFMEKFGKKGYLNNSLNQDAKKRHLKYMDFYKSMTKTI